MQQQANQRLQQFKPECKLLESDTIKELEPNELKALLQELKSTKNWLLIEEKRYTNPVEIAYRDGAIIVVNILIKKVLSVLQQKIKNED